MLMMLTDDDLVTEEMEQEIATIEGLAEIARAQFFVVLEGVSPDVLGDLRVAVLDGRINGETYWRASAGCGCPLGMIAFLEGAERPGEVACWRPTATTYALEEWARPIRPGDVPDHTASEYTGPFRAAVLVSWIDEHLAGAVA